MKSLILISAFPVLCTQLFSQVAVMPSQTHAAMHAIQKDLNPSRSEPSKKILDFYPIYTIGTKYHVATLAKTNAEFDKTQAIEDGFDVGAVVGSVVSMRVPLYLFHEGFTYPGIEYIEVAEKLDPELDKALIETHVNLVHQGVSLPQSYTGKNVLIGIVDWGFDYTHPTFYDTSLAYNRIFAAWDQVKIIGTPPPGFSHGAYYSDAGQLAAAHSDTFSIVTDYHGTHVAGIAGGSGGSTKYRGVGIESDFLFSQMRTDVSSSLDAFQWMYETAQAAGRRLVINNSWGGYRTFPLDGTSLLSQAIDEMSDLGVVFVFSAGNNGDTNFHLKKSFNNDSLQTRMMGFDYVNDKDLWGQTVTMWGEPGHPFAAKLRLMDAANVIVGETELYYTDTSAAHTDTFLIIGADTVFYQVIMDAAHPLNGRPQMTLNVKNTNPALKNILFASSVDGKVHFWNTRLTVYGGGNWGFGFTAPIAGYVNGDKNYGIGHPGVTSSVITAAAHQTNFHLTTFSSYGPRMDDVQKPDLSAPGQDICSAFNYYSRTNATAVTQVPFQGQNYKFVRLSGTSMSAPMITGVISLLLEANPSLTPAEVKEIMLTTALTDGITGDISPEGHVRWGHGKLDALAAIQSQTNTSTKDILPSKNYVFPNPAQDKISVSMKLHGNETYRLNRIDGRLISGGHFDGSLDVSKLHDGLYILSVENKHQIESMMVYIQK